MTKSFKKFKKTFFGAILGPFCPNFSKNQFSWKKWLCQFLNILIITMVPASPEKNTELTDGQTDNSDFTGVSVRQGSNY